jgi:spore germination protein GerM
MKQRSKKKGQKKSRRKGRTGRLLAFLVFMGLSVFVVYLFRQDISDALKPLLEKKVAKKEKKVVTLFFSEEEEEYLVGEKREISKTGKIEEEARETVLELIKGPKEKLIPTLSPHTRLLTLQVDPSGVARVNFDQTLSKEHPGGSSAEMMTIYSIVNSLTLNFPQVKRVQILINGKAVESIAGHISLKQPIPSNLNMVKKVGKKRGIH